jgi:hypothetical protein
VYVLIHVNQLLIKTRLVENFDFVLLEDIDKAMMMMMLSMHVMFRFLLPMNSSMMIEDVPVDNGSIMKRNHRTNEENIFICLSTTSTTVTCKL